ncbi:ATP-dependent RNA helicase, partial [Staphylococcus aureus]|nr:ATP-dependent RNA helicase [Staphylococcus aureus]
GRKMSALRPPHRKEVLQAREDDIKEKVENWMSKESESRLKRISTELLNEYNDVDLVAALLQELVEANDEVEVQLTFEKPLSRKGRNGKPSGSRNRNSKRGNPKFDSKSKRSKGYSS